MNSNYAVIFTYSFDSEVSVYLFKTEDEAKKFLLDSLKEEVRIDIEENGWEVEHCISDDGRYAKITNNFDDGDRPIDITEMRIGQIYQ